MEANKFQLGDKVRVSDWDRIGYVTGVPREETTVFGMIYPASAVYAIRFEGDKECVIVKPEYVEAA